MISPQFSLLPEGDDQRGSAAHPPQGTGGAQAQFPAMMSTEVGQLVLFEVPPDVLGRVQFGGIGRQILDQELSPRRRDILAYEPATVNARPVPEDQQFAAQMAAQVPQKRDDLGALDRAVEELEVKVHQRDPRDYGKRLPVEMIRQDRCATAGSPRAYSMRLLAQAALVNTDDQPAFGQGFFLMAGKRSRFQRRMARSSRSSARPTGRWQLHPNCCRSR